MITVTFTEAELQSLVGLLDAGVRGTGIRSVKEAAVLLVKLEEAAAPLASGKSEEEEKEDD